MASLGGHCPLLVLPRHSSHHVLLSPHPGLPQYLSLHSLIATRPKHRHTFPVQPLPSRLSRRRRHLSPLLLQPRLQAADAPFPSPVLSQAVRQTLPPEALARSRIPLSRLPLLLERLCHSLRIPHPTRPNLFPTGNAAFQNLPLIVQPVHLAHRRPSTRVQARRPRQRTTNTAIVPKASPAGDRYHPLHSTVPLASPPLFRLQLAFLVNALEPFPHQ
jgi:hypothetical protein